MTVQDFFDTYLGLWIETNKGSDPGTLDQCVDLWRVFNRKVVGAPDMFGNAVNFWTNYPVSFYDKIPNTPSGVPQLGDVMIWGTNYGRYGHIAVCTNIANTKTFTSFDQNDPIGSSCHYQPHTYAGLLGWLRPINEVTKETFLGKSKEYWLQIEQDREDLLKQLGEIDQGKIRELEKKIEIYDNFYGDLKEIVRPDKSDFPTMLGETQSLADRAAKVDQTNQDLKEYATLVNQSEYKKESFKNRLNELVASKATLVKLRASVKEMDLVEKYSFLVYLGGIRLIAFKKEKNGKG